MEWFVTAKANIPVAELQRHVRIETLAAWCARAPALAGAMPVEAGSVWDAWCVHREVIRDGLRFSLPGAAQALQWTLSAGGQLPGGTVRVHCTLNIAVADAASNAAVMVFMEAWREGLEAGALRLQAQRAAQAAAASVPCAPWFG